MAVPCVISDAVPIVKTCVTCVLSGSSASGSPETESQKSQRQRPGSRCGCAWTIHAVGIRFNEVELRSWSARAAGDRRSRHHGS